MRHGTYVEMLIDVFFLIPSFEVESLLNSDIIERDFNTFSINLLIYSQFTLFIKLFNSIYLLIT